MLSIKKYAAIDIGSNAVRLLISNIIEQKGRPVQFKKNSLVRVPIRLGADVFIKNKISKENTARILDTMLAFKLLMKSHKVVKYKACATSAMRESDNGAKVVEAVLKHAGISIDVIDGEEEAAIIAATDLNKFIEPNKIYLYVDVGGGSTEFTVIDHGKQVISRSFKIGTVRLLNDMVGKDTWQELQNWITDNTKVYDKIEVIGSGGNINKIFKISGKAMGKPLTYFYMTSYYNTLQSYSYEERITELDLNQDRADVIIPAMRIYMSAMKWSGAKNIYVPKIGLADGIIKSIYYDTVSSNTQ
ncbi:Ppx/GppA phosphatase family protein [Algibacter lectus]|uniref:Exopolyphosphatase/guanosine-5'-triphosphate, 3'-diphosphate pyrophosphatase n=1 Tax=Algibacter lectus TaxID=221126 RepID=A0A4R8MFT9_9FLAO|nr:rod shape-determining protein [Algibacter lectus]MDO7136211.1 rod shape-determining protein [Algibacter lectus]MWW23425.1 exopolyphosphatase [Algibacter lectus]TDY63898.1 exopolyphosphatase/guanosine-5'-triphosphate,3'-diphosphate pyrophosphatase [Algibacter lectus]SFC24221.1 exopolyphosphatase / guanosine-5'-triphosphate,3'-diphosphate pyrophosphatase [Algibacter lectus]